MLHTRDHRCAALGAWPANGSCSGGSSYRWAAGAWRGGSLPSTLGPQRRRLWRRCRLCSSACGSGRKRRGYIATKSGTRECPSSRLVSLSAVVFVVSGRVPVAQGVMVIAPFGAQFWSVSEVAVVNHGYGINDARERPRSFGIWWPGAIASSARERGAASGLSVTHRARPLTERREGAWSRRVPFRRVRSL